VTCVRALQAANITIAQRFQFRVIAVARPHCSAQLRNKGAEVSLSFKGTIKARHASYIQFRAAA
jgi:hypothetical protein